MRRSTTTVAVILAGCLVCLAGLSPLTIQDLSLMLRSGYSSEDVARELSSRRFIGSFDEEAEKILTKAGAKPDLIAVLRNGGFTLSPAETAAAQKDLDAKNRLRALQGAQAQRLEARYQNELTKKTESAPPVAAPSGKIIDQIKGDLVTSKNGILSTFNDQVLEKKKLIALYFSAHWCQPCRIFTPKLVEFYNRVAPAHPEFELLFVSNDRSGPAMEDYMRDSQMPWPAVRFDKIQEKQALTQYAGAGIPCLVVIDSDGQIVSNSYNGKNYVGPQKVLNDLDAIFARGDGTQVALGR